MISRWWLWRSLSIFDHEHIFLTADQVSVNFINLWSSHTTGLLEPPRWKSEPPRWKCGAASEKGLPDPQKMKIWSQKKSIFPNPSEHGLFAKKRIKIGKIWPLQLHFWSTDAYMGSPPYAIFPIPDTKKYSTAMCYCRTCVNRTTTATGSLITTHNATSYPTVES